MEYTTLGSTGMEVSRLCLGCMSFSMNGASNTHDWVLDEDESREIIERAIELGINFFDTANAYSNGESEKVLGKVLNEHNREEYIVSTKCYFPTNLFTGEEEPHPNASGLSRKAIEQELQNSLDRLGMDTIDLYQIHRWDHNTPIEQTLKALDDAVRRGKVRYLGASSMWTYQFAKAVYTSDRLGLERFVNMQNHYNLAYREEEREMLPFCREENIGVTPWSPLAQGYLTRPHEEMTSTKRGEELTERHQEYRQGGGPTINERVEELAEQKGVTMAQIALAWLLHKDTVDAPIIGTTSVEHLEQAVEALEINLTDSEMQYLEEPYEPLQIAGDKVPGSQAG
jgi:aryl-alcohol dehydrogenase-like predicted oxidoreductase